MRKTGWFLVAVLLIFSFDAFGWSSCDPNDEHEDMSEYLLGLYPSPFLYPYLQHFHEVGLDINEIVDVSNSETYPPTGEHWRWSKVNSLNDLVQLPLTSDALGAIFHAAQDSGVPANHLPGADVWDGYDPADQNAAEKIMEHSARAQGYYAGDPVLAYDDILNGNWFDKLDTFITDSFANATIYRDWYLANPYDEDWTGLSADYIKPALLQALRFNEMLAVHFLDYYEVGEPGSTIAHWEFSEGYLTSSVGQITVNSKGSNAVNLQFGSSITSSDVHDPAWTIGVSNEYHEAIHCKGWTEAGNNCTYVRQTGTWTWGEADMLSPYSSYTVEVVFNVEDYITNVNDPNYKMGILTYRDDDPNNSAIMYRIRTYKQLVSGVLHTFVDFYSVDPNFTGHTITFDTSNAGLGIDTNKWYYLAAIFHYETSTMDLMVRDIATGRTVSTNGTMGPPAGFASGDTMAPTYLIGSSSYSSGKCFDGYIDDVRISNRALNIDIDRLYNSTLAHWRFDEDVNQIVYNTKGVDEADLQLGSSSGTDTHDPDWDEGYWGSALHGEGYVQNGNVATYAVADYASETSGWSLATANAIVPPQSYSVEAIFNVEEYPSSGTTTMGIVDYSDYTDSSIRYRIITYLSGTHTGIQYQSGTTAVSWDTNSSGMQIVPGKWYYIAAFFDADTNTVDLMLRDLSSTSGTTITKLDSTMQPMTSYTSTSRPVFFVGTDTFNSKSFDGQIDEVRISNNVLAEKDRLYMHGSTIAHWKFDYDYATVGQVIDNVDNDLLLPLELGQSRERLEDGDTREPVLEPREGWYAGSVHLGENSAVTYALADPCNGNGWLLTEANAAAPTGSYSVEAIFNADVHSSEVGIVYYVDYNNSNIKYKITTYRSAAGNTYIRFTSGSTTVDWNTKSAGLEIVAGKWYYIGAFFDSVSDKVYFVLRDMQAGDSTMKASSGASAPHVTAFTTSSRPVLFVGAGSFNSKAFDGYIDEVRISNQYLPADCRLYNLPR